jgi:hypothetical protein
MATDYTRCKAFGHQWDDAPPPPWNRHFSDRNHGVLHFRCVQCSMYKRATVHLYTGETRNAYKRPDDYNEVKQTVRAWKSQYALTVIRRSKSKSKRKAKK